MRSQYGRLLAAALVFVLAGCAETRGDAETAVAEKPSVPSDSSPSPTDQAATFPIAAFADINEDPVSEKTAAKFQAALRDMAGEGGMAATVMSPDGTWSGAVGKADGVRDVRVNDQFAIASVTKSVTAASFEYTDTNYLLLGLVIEQVREQPVADVLRNGVLSIDGVERLIYQPDEVPTEPMAMPDGKSSAELEKGGGYLPSLAGSTSDGAAATYHPSLVQPPMARRQPWHRTRPLWRVGGGRSAPARSSPKPR